MSKNFKPWTTRPDVQLHCVVRTPRVLECLDIAWIHRLAASDGSYSDEQLRHCFYIDLSQGIERHSFGDPSLMATGIATSRLDEC